MLNIIRSQSEKNNFLLGAMQRFSVFIGVEQFVAIKV